MHKTIFLYLKMVPMIYLMNHDNSLLAQEAEAPARLSLSVSTGMTIIETHWSFTHGSQQVPVRSRLSYGFGLVYGPIVSFENLFIHVSLETGYGETSTDEIDNYSSDLYIHSYSPSYSAQMVLQRRPVMMWLTFISDGRITPYIRAGGGISQTRFQEKYAYPEGPSVDVKSWNFTWGIGGGILGRISDHVAIGLYLDDWVTTTDLTDRSSGSNISVGILAPIKLTTLGIRMVASQ
jgi:opacity protein-like surface antigen